MSAVWPSDLGEPIFPLDNFRIAQMQSRNTRNTREGRVPSFEEARRYAMGESPQEPMRHEDRRG